MKTENIPVPVPKFLNFPGLLTVLSVVAAVAEYFVPGVSHALQEATTVAAGLVAGAYTHGKIVSSAGSGK